MSADDRDQTTEAALRMVRDELAMTRDELATARRDLHAMEDRFTDLEQRARLGIAQDRQVASTEFLARQRRAQARHDRLLRLARPFRGSRFFAPIERAARRLRAALQR